MLLSIFSGADTPRSANTFPLLTLNSRFVFICSALCLPLGVGSVRLFRKIAEAVKLAGLVVDEGHQSKLMEMVEEPQPAAEEAGAADVILHKGDKWHGYDLRLQATVQALAEVLRPKFGGANPVHALVENEELADRHFTSGWSAAARAALEERWRVRVAPVTPDAVAEEAAHILEDA